MIVIAIIVAATVLVPGLVLAAVVAAHWAPDRPLSELKARWAPPPSTFVEVQGMNVHLRDEGPRGDPVPVVLLHGTSSSLHTWDRLGAGTQGKAARNSLRSAGHRTDRPTAGCRLPHRALRAFHRRYAGCARRAALRACRQLLRRSGGVGNGAGASGSGGKADSRRCGRLSVPAGVASHRISHRQNPGAEPVDGVHPAAARDRIQSAQRLRRARQVARPARFRQVRSYGAYWVRSCSRGRELGAQGGGDGNSNTIRIPPSSGASRNSLAP